jgi:PhoH-like ATPase
MTKKLKGIKTFVLDTNVLLQSPTSIFAFQNNDVVIPEAVIEELDDFKKDKSEKGFNAREVIRLIDELRQNNKGCSLKSGLLMENSGLLFVYEDSDEQLLPLGWDPRKPDNRIIQVCKSLQNKGKNVHLVTKDIIERIKADTCGIIVEDFKSEQSPSINDQYSGRVDLVTEVWEYFDEFCRTGSVDAVTPEMFIENQFINFVCGNSSKLAVFRNGKIEKLLFEKSIPYGIKPRNSGQIFFIEALMRPVNEAPLVIAKGPAGTAKTLLSLAAGLEQTFNDEVFRKILVCRPNITMDENIGFLPGTEEEKIAPLMRPILDNLEILVDSKPNERYKDEKALASKIKYLFDTGVIVTQAVSFLRGRSVAHQWVLIDEAQNLTNTQVKAIITRAGEGTKIIMVGDPAQIDHPYLDSRTNGLSYASEIMKGSDLCWQITFKGNESVRSKLASEAAKRM